MKRAAHAARRRDDLYRLATLTLAMLGGKRHRTCQWALGLRFPAENLDGLTPAAREAFEAARTHALREHRQLIGLTSGHREAEHQARLFAEAVRDAGSIAAARRRVLPPGESRHVAGTALDVRPLEGARWLDRHGARFGLYRIYDNEWWHFEYRPDGRPQRLPHPAAAHPVDEFEMITAWTG